MFDFQREMDRLLNPLCILGLWYKGEGGFNKYLYYGYSLVLTIFYNTHNVAQIANIVVNFTNLKEWSLSGVVALTEALTSFKGFFIVAHRNRIAKIRQKINQEVFQPRSLEQVKSTKATLRHFSFWYMSLITGPVFTVAGFALYAYFGTNQATLPFAAAYPFNVSEFPMYELTFIHQCATSCVMGYIQVYSDCFICLSFAIVVIQFDILCDNLKNIQAEEELLKCIKHHQEITLLYGEIFKVAKFWVMGQLALSTISFCFTTFQMSLVPPGGGQFWGLSEYAGASITQLLMFCWWGNEITYKGLKVPQAAFQSNWVDGTPEFRKSLAFLIHRAQKPLVIRAVGFFAVSLNTFMLVVKNSYSFYALLRSSNKD